MSGKHSYARTKSVRHRHTWRNLYFSLSPSLEDYHFYNYSLPFCDRVFYFPIALASGKHSSHVTYSDKETWEKWCVSDKKIFPIFTTFLTHNALDFRTLMGKMIPTLHRSLYNAWFCSNFHQGRRSSFLESGLAHDLVWPIECGRSHDVLFYNLIGRNPDTVMWTSLA